MAAIKPEARRAKTAKEASTTTGRYLEAEKERMVWALKRRRSGW
jgi:hypothetical protein